MAQTDRRPNPSAATGNTKRPSTPVAVATFLLLVLIWGTTWAVIRVGLVGVPPFTAASLRFLFASLLLLALAPRFHAKLTGGAREWKVWIASGVFTFAGSYGVVYWSEQWVPSGLAAILFATYPLCVALLARALLPGDRLRPIAFAGIVLGFAGVAILFSEDLRRLGGPNVAKAAIVFLLSPISSAFGTVLAKRGGAGIHPIAMNVLPMAIGAAILGGCALAFERDVPLHWTGAAIASLAYLTVVGTAVAFTCYFWLLAHFSATRLSLITYGTPVVAVLVGSVWLGERLTPRVLVGAAVILSGVILAGRRKVKSPAGS